MKKKILSLVLAIAVFVPCMFMLVACGGGFKEGVYYKMDKVELVCESQEVEEKLDALITLSGKTEEEFLEQFKSDVKMIFEEGVCKGYQGETLVGQYYYSVEDGMVVCYLTEEKTGDPIQKFKIEGNSLVFETSYSSVTGVTIKTVYTQE